MEKGFWKWVFTNVYFYLILFVWFVIVFYSENEYPLIEYIFIIPFMALLLLIPFAIFRFVNNDRKKKGFPIKSWKWIIYIIGWFGMLSLIFWIYQYISYLSKNYGDKFLSMEFHKRTYYWGWVMIVLFLFVGIILLIS